MSNQTVIVEITHKTDDPAMAKRWTDNYLGRLSCDGEIDDFAYVLPLWYIRYDEFGENYDLVIHAESREAALAIWRAHWEFENPEQMPAYSGRIPPATEPGAVNWQVIAGDAI